MDKGLDFEQAKRMAARMGMGVMAQEEAAEYFIKMYKLFTEKVTKIGVLGHTVGKKTSV